MKCKCKGCKAQPRQACLNETQVISQETLWVMSEIDTIAYHNKTRTKTVRLLKGW